MGIIGALIASALIGAAASAISSGINYASTAKTNEQNKELQSDINAQNQYNIEHAHQIEMQDLKDAGLNPVLTATGGQGAPVQMLQSPKMQAPQMDLSGIGSAMQGIQHMITMQYMMQMREEIANERNATLSAIAKGHDSQSAANAALRASTNLNIAQSKIHSSRQASSFYENPLSKMSKADRERFLKIVHYNWLN